jgi:YidC/Oxa1 family membrane protein insertase
MPPIAIIPAEGEAPQWMQDFLGPLVDASNAILQFWEGLVGSWGVAIILMTFTIRLAILPLTFKGVKSMQRLQQLQPEMKRLQERYKDDKQRLNQELMKFYQEQKVNPLGSCLPLLLQIPFFMALFVLLRDDTFKEDIAGDQSFLFIPDLAAPVTNNIPVLAIMIVLYIGTQLASTAVTAISADPTQRKIMFALPFVFTIFVINCPAGLLLYWITTNTWTIGQQLLVRKLYPKPDPIEAEDDDKPAPARGKPPSERKAAEETDGKKDGQKEKQPATRKRAAAAKAAAGGGNGAGGNGRKTSKPPGSPRKKRKRSGRRR